MILDNPSPNRDMRRKGTIELDTIPSIATAYSEKKLLVDLPNSLFPGL